MSLQVVGSKSKDPNFQNRCWGAVMSSVRSILAAATDSNAVQGAGGADLTTDLSKAQARKFATLSHLSTDRTIANLVLLNSVIAADPDGVDDSAIEYQMNQIWLTLMDIG